VFRPQDTYCLSRFVGIRLTPRGFIVESVLSGRSLPLDTPTAWQLLRVFARPVCVNDLVAACDERRRAAILRFAERCWEYQFLTGVNDGGRTSEDENALAHWEYADLMFHVRSRRGRNPSPVGATYHRRGVLPPAPLVKTRDGGRCIPLQRADLAMLMEQDITLTEALETRRSVYTTRALTLDALGEFLYRTCRVTATEEIDGEPLARKVYPSGGSLHAIEVYVICAACDGLESGIYAYDAASHALQVVAGLTPDARELLQEAQRGTGRLQDLPPVLLVLSARFRRVMWKYQSIAYRLILNEVGAIFQTMYLVATAMRIGGCAIGAGNSDCFARAIGSDYYDETSVGEFILGGLPDGHGQ
jgi:SagB-type dehydrogenase family enzyme